MQEFAEKLIAQARGMSLEPTTPDTPSNAPVMASNNLYSTRIGMWPLVSSDAPDISMGIMSALAFLLERYVGIIVYRLAASVEGSPEEYRWNLEQSQFSVDDWQLEALDENVGVWGTLEHEGANWLLVFEIENDLAEDDETLTFTYRSKTLSDLVNLLPKVASDIASAIGIEELKTIAPDYVATTAQDDSLETLLKQVFLWERKLMLFLFGVTWPESELRADFDSLLNAAKAVGDDFSGWAVANTLARAMLRTTPMIAATLTPLISDAVDQVADSSRTPALLLARALFNNDSEQDAYDILEEDIGKHPEDSLTRLALAILYQQGQHLQEAIEALHEAIEANAANSDLLMVYGGIVVALRQNGLVVPRYVLIEAPEREFDYMLDEAAAAYEAILEQDPKHLAALQRRVLLLMELDDPEVLWTDFERLVEMDDKGEAIRRVVDSFDLLEDVSEGLKILGSAVGQHPERVDLRVSYGAALLADGDTDAAKEQLEAAAEMTDDPEIIPEIERLLLSANDPEFEIRLGELTDLLNGNKPIAHRDIEFLEEVVESAPSFGQGYLLLARGYLTRNESAEALETLLDGQKTLPDDPEITEQLARLLWNAGERDLAFDYLNKGLGQNPDAVPLLALTGKFLYDDGQEEEAREFLLRAESLNPQNRVLREVQRYIASNFNE